MYFTFLCSDQPVRIALRQRPATVKTGGDTITIDPDAKTEDGDSNQIPNPLTVHNSLAELAKAVGFDVKAPTVPAEQGISETEVAAVVSSAL